MAHATPVGGVARGGRVRGSSLLAISVLAVLGCAGSEPASPEAGGAIPQATGVSIHVARPPSGEERYCAWYGDEGPDQVLYFGEAAFWSAKAKAGGDPTADLARAGPQLVGRFDLADEKWLPALAVGEPESRSGVWDVLVRDDGEVYFTTFFEDAGSVLPATGRVRRLALGGALNELAEGPDGTVVATRYGSGKADDGNGDVIAFDRDGRTVKSWSLVAPPGFRVAPKTPLWDDLRRELLVTADHLPLTAASGAPAQVRHDAVAIDEHGAARLVPPPPEINFAAKSRDGTIYRAEVDGHALWLAVVPPPGRGELRRIALDNAYAPELDFVQDIQVAADGRVAVTRWSGVVHVLHPDGTLHSVALPHPDASGLYYTAVLHRDRLCATYCADVTVVCADAP